MNKLNALQEQKRLETLYGYEILDSDNEKQFDEITRTIATVCQCEFAMISFVDKDRQWFKSKVGTDMSEFPRDISFCDHTIANDGLLIIEDASKDSRFSDNPIVTGEPHLRFYAGASLVAPNGQKIGTLCITDTSPKTLDLAQKNLLTTFSNQIINIMELEKKAKQINETEKMRETVLNSMLEGMVLQNHTGAIVEFNPAALGVLGLTEGQLIGRDSMDPRWKSIRIDGSPFPGEEHPAMVVIRTGKKVENVIMGIETPDEGLRWVRINSMPIQTEKGFNAVTTFQDITELFEKNSEVESYAKGLDSYAIVAKTDKDGLITYVNNKFCETSGYTKKEILGKSHSILNSGYHNKSFFEDMWDTISSGRIWSGEIQNRAKDGRNYWVYTTITPLIDRNGEIREYIAFRYDVTSRKLADIELEKKENKLRQLFEQSQDAIMTLEPPNWNFTSCNPATLKRFKVDSEDEFKKLGPWNISPEFQPDGRASAEKAKEVISAALEKGVHIMDWTHRTLDGVDIPCTVLLSKIEEGEKDYIHAVVRDVSEISQLAESLSSANEDLQNSLSEQRALKNILNISISHTLDLEEKLEKGLEEVFNIETLSLEPKASIRLYGEGGLESTFDFGLSERVDGPFLDKIFSDYEAKSFDKITDVQFVGCDEEFTERPYQYQHCLVPILGKDEAFLGAIVLYLKKKYSNVSEQAKILSSVADIFSSIIHTEELRKNLVDSNSYLDLALEGAGLGVWDWHLKDNSVIFDRRWAEMLGHNIEEISMDIKSWESRVHPDDIASCYADINAYMEGKTSSYENVHRTKHKNGHWVSILGKGRFSAWDKDGSPTRFTGTNLDVSELQDAKLKLSLLYQKSPFGFAFCDMDGNLLDVNSKYEEITGYSEEELKKLSYWELTPNKYEEQEAEQIESLKQNGSYGPYKKEYTRKSGELIPVELNGFIVEDFDGQDGIWSIVEDITEKTSQDEEIQKQKQIALHHSKLASIGELAAGVGHEINNPLAIAKGYVASIEKKSRAESLEGEDLYKYLEKINLAIDRIASIVRGLRTFSRSDSSEISEFSPKQALEESFLMINEIYQRDGINVSLNCTFDDRHFLRGNRGKFQQVIMNLISNAKDATRGLSSRRIEIEAVVRSNKAFIEVVDNGMGIPEELREKIFDPFFTTKEVNEGTGIGLSLVHSFVQEFDGDLSFESTKEEGTRFIIEIPIFIGSAVERLTEELVPANRRLKPVDIILVDDEEGVRDLLSDILEDMGLRVTALENGKRALDCYLSDPTKYKIIISDMQMPEMDGPSLLRAIRENSSTDQLKFIFITGGININFEDESDSLNRMMDGFFLKPFDEDDIFNTLQACLSDIFMEGA
ncbi:MAG: PAS domain S-box protein [Bdellovibrionales bacterium]